MLLSIQVCQVTGQSSTKPVHQEKVELSEIPERLKELAKEYPHTCYSIEGGGWMYEHK